MKFFEVARKEDYNALLDYASGVPTEEEYADTLVNVKNLKMEELRQKLLRPLTVRAENLLFHMSLSSKSDIAQDFELKIRYFIEFCAQNSLLYNILRSKFDISEF